MKALRFMKLHIFYLLIATELSTSLPDSNVQEFQARRRDPRQTIQRNPDGSITASFAASQAFQVPGGGFGGGGGGGFDVAQTINIGPQGSSSSGGQSFNSDIMGNRMSSSNANSQNSRFGPNGFSSTGANSGANSFSNPFFQSSNAQANAFANQFANNNGFGF